MSNFYSRAKRPGGDTFEKVEMNDDAYGKHKYGVIFPDCGGADSIQFIDQLGLTSVN